MGCGGTERTVRCGRWQVQPAAGWAPSFRGVRVPLLLAMDHGGNVHRLYARRGSELLPNSPFLLPSAFPPKNTPRQGSRCYADWLWMPELWPRLPKSCMSTAASPLLDGPLYLSELAKLCRYLSGQSTFLP